MESSGAPDTPAGGTADRHGTGHEVTDGRAAGTVVRRRLAGGDDDGLSVVDEARLLEVVADRVPVPVPRVVRTWPDEEAMEMTRVPGVPLLEWLADHPAPPVGVVDGWAAPLGRLQAALAAIPERLVADLVPRDETTPAEYLAELEPQAAEVVELLEPPDREAVERFLLTPAPPPAARLRLCHGDLGAEHVFVDRRTGVVTGVIDWSDAAVMDQALDLGLVLRDLGVSARDRALEHLGTTDGDIVSRSTFYARARALEDLQFGTANGLELYRRSAIRAIRFLFAAVTPG